MYDFCRSRSFYEPSRKPPSISVNDRPARASRTLYSRYNTEPRSMYPQSFFQYHVQGEPTPRAGTALQKLGHGAESLHDIFKYNYSFNKYPLHMRGNRILSASTDGYVHDQSVFMRTVPPRVSHFIIHPEWISERLSLRGSSTMIQSNSGKLNKE